MISKLAGDSTWSRYALVWSGIQAVMIIALESVILALHLKESGNIENAMNGALTALGNPELYQSSKKSILLSTRVLSVYHVLFIVAQLFQLILLCDAMFNKNTIQIIAIVAFNWAIVGYAGVQLKQASDILVETPGESLKNMILYYFRLPPAPTPYHESLPYEIAVIVLMSIFAIGFAVIAYKLYKEFGWTIYKKIGADLAMRDMYMVYQIFIMILKFDVFFQYGYSAQFLCVIYLSDSDDRIKTITIHLILSTGASIILPFLAWHGLKRENKISMSCFIAGAVGTTGYNVYKLNQVFQEAERFVGANKFLTFFSIIDLLLGTLTIYLAYKCMKNFNNGLNAHIGKVSGTNIYPMESTGGQNTKRWSIE